MLEVKFNALRNQSTRLKLKLQACILDFLSFLVNEVEFSGSRKLGCSMWGYLPERIMAGKS
ncbi:hypothetical protein CFP56_031677 [Quercus suber]|uniref:Uncharacterized protein n=1 Tax=Quercus suber TaxID=58331 RepID=A0AAW0JIX1_QUESU